MKVVSALLSLLFLTSCDPLTVMLGGAAVIGTTAVRNQRGVSGSISDTELQTKINHALFNKDKYLFDKVELAVKHGMVVVIGYMDNQDQRERAIKIVKDVDGSSEIFDETKVQKAPNASDLANDASITSRIKSSLLFDGNIASLNYDITTVKGIVYICGTAKSKYERDVVLSHARTTYGVEKVIAYVKVNESKNKQDKRN